MHRLEHNDWKLGVGVPESATACTTFLYWTLYWKCSRRWNWSFRYCMSRWN